MSNINQQKLINNNKMRERYVNVGGGPFERIYTKLWGGEVCVYQNQSHMGNCYIASAGTFFFWFHWLTDPTTATPLMNKS